MRNYGGKMSYISFKAQDMGFDAHLTVLYLGEDEPTREQRFAFDKIMADGKWQGDSLAKRWFIDLFGPETNIPVLRVFVPPELLAFRMLCESIMGNGSEYKNWNPHITLDLAHNDTIHIPSEIKLTDLSLS
jgi:hypothetical protein